MLHESVGKYSFRFVAKGISVDSCTKLQLVDHLGMGNTSCLVQPDVNNATAPTFFSKQIQLEMAFC